MTYRPTAKQRLGKHIPAGANARNNRTSIAMPWSYTSTSQYVLMAWCLINYAQR
jgi:hypothetical protein